MRKITVLSMITLDGVMQAPGGPEEDTSGNFKYGGWTAPYSDDEFNKVVQEELSNLQIIYWEERHLISGKVTGLNMATFGQASMKALSTYCPIQRKNQIGRTQFFSKAWQILKR